MKKTTPVLSINKHRDGYEAKLPGLTPEDYRFGYMFDWICVRAVQENFQKPKILGNHYKVWPPKHRKIKLTAHDTPQPDAAFYTLQRGQHPISKEPLGKIRIGDNYTEGEYINLAAALFLNDLYQGPDTHVWVTCKVIEYGEPDDDKELDYVREHDHQPCY